MTDDERYGDVATTFSLVVDERSVHDRLGEDVVNNLFDRFDSVDQDLPSVAQGDFPPAG